MATNTVETYEKITGGISYHYQGIWWLTMLRGILILLLGILVLIWPAATFLAVLWLLGLFSILDGISDFMMGVVLLGRRQGGGWWLMGLGLVGLLFGILILRYPGASAVTLVYLIGIWFILSGFTSLFRSATSVMMKFIYLIGGILGILLGILLLFRPIVTGLAFFWVLGIYGLVAGPLTIVLALQEKSSTPKGQGKLSYG